MNVERMQAVADAIERDAEHFNMFRYFGRPGDTSMVDVYPRDAVNLDTRKFNCGTTACIAGFAVALFATREQIVDLPIDGIDALAAKLLGLSSDPCLFTWAPEDYYHQRRDGAWTWITLLSEVTPAQAAAEIRRMVAAQSETA